MTIELVVDIIIPLYQFIRSLF